MLFLCVCVRLSNVCVCCGCVRMYVITCVYVCLMCLYVCMVFVNVSFVLFAVFVLLYFVCYYCVVSAFLYFCKCVSVCVCMIVLCVCMLAFAMLL